MHVPLGNRSIFHPMPDGCKENEARLAQYGVQRYLGLASMFTTLVVNKRIIMSSPFDSSLLQTGLNIIQSSCSHLTYTISSH